MNNDKHKPNPKKVAARKAYHARCVMMALREQEIGVNPKYRNGRAKHSISEKAWEEECKRWDALHSLNDFFGRVVRVAR